jgi:hypothetical protein
MHEPCFEPGDAARVAALAESDPLRAHARECPRCRALLDAYAAFLAADPGAVPASDLADANARLSGALAAATRAAPVTAPRAAPRAASPEGEQLPSRRASASPPRTFWERIAHPSLRPAWAFLTVALVAGALVLWSRPTGRDATLVLRGEVKAAIPVIERAEWSGDTLVLSWRGVPAADGYEVRFLSTALADLGRTGPNSDSTVVLALSSLAFRPGFGDTVVVRVEALKDGDAVATSDARVVARAGGSR